MNKKYCKTASVSLRPYKASSLSSNDLKKAVPEDTVVVSLETFLDFIQGAAAIAQHPAKHLDTCIPQEDKPSRIRLVVTT